MFSSPPRVYRIFKFYLRKKNSKVKMTVKIIGSVILGHVFQNKNQDTWLIQVLTHWDGFS